MIKLIGYWRREDENFVLLMDNSETENPLLIVIFQPFRKYLIETGINRSALFL
jgi:hypothetical protein